ncbi:unnamed protein product [Didymodactylos carnosus]|uniref:Uncharacterized protein n=1 Tax=Didymodactylos carnosus TaxID=1234261 RepID=A0A813VXS0_9BILA|nr:unnamed protein product [Didymodactylos carnosus]CAF0976706.1 unnamed protein product [Didymodactylos carnosus]CAF3634341.1 unnamed protein product [Didymodactylos carnosus]CAF3747497.1 unnamed protein product [Didymodactylos carnosus]
MIMSSVICCGLVPMFIRLWLARKRYYRYRVERNLIEQCMPFAFHTQKSIYSDITFELYSPISFEQTTPSDELHSMIYNEIPFIDSKNDGDDMI